MRNNRIVQAQSTSEKTTRSEPFTRSPVQALRYYVRLCVCMHAGLKVCMDGHGRRPGTYFQGWTPSCHLLGSTAWTPSMQRPCNSVIPLRHFQQHLIF